MPSRSHKVGVCVVAAVKKYSCRDPIRDIEVQDSIVRRKVNLSSRSHKVSVGSSVPTESAMPSCFHKSVNSARSTKGA